MDSVNKTGNNGVKYSFCQFRYAGYRYDWGDLGEKEAFGHNKNNKKKRETIQRRNKMETRSRVYTRQYARNLGECLRRDVTPYQGLILVWQIVPDQKVFFY